VSGFLLTLSLCLSRFMYISMFFFYHYYLPFYISPFVSFLTLHISLTTSFFHDHNNYFRDFVILTPVSSQIWYLWDDFAQCWDFSGFSLSCRIGQLDCILHIWIPCYRVLWMLCNVEFFCWIPDQIGIASSYLPLVCSSNQLPFKPVLCVCHPGVTPEPRQRSTLKSNTRVLS
jgi:hypothetical protein